MQFQRVAEGTHLVVSLLTDSVRGMCLPLTHLVTPLQFILPVDTSGHGTSGLNYRGRDIDAQNHRVSQLEEPLSSLNI